MDTHGSVAWRLVSISRPCSCAENSEVEAAFRDSLALREQLVANP
jgi:hypothetical protein